MESNRTGKQLKENLPANLPAKFYREKLQETIVFFSLLISIMIIVYLTSNGIISDNTLNNLLQHFGGPAEDFTGLVGNFLIMFLFVSGFFVVWFITIFILQKFFSWIILGKCVERKDV